MTPAAGVEWRSRTGLAQTLDDEIGSVGGRMPLHRHRKPRTDHPFVGTWHITEMELWDEDYLNMECRAFLEIRPDDSGEFQFGLVRGMIDGYLEGEPPEQRFAFTWDGSDEMDPVSGSGWMRLRSTDEVRGLIKIHLADRSTFTARRVGGRG